MAKHLTRFQLVRSVAGTISAMIACAIALFAAAHHLAG
jgi:hypothetical protein